MTAPSPQIQGLTEFYRMKSPDYVRALSALYAALDGLEASSYEGPEETTPGDVIDAWKQFKSIREVK